MEVYRKSAIRIVYFCFLLVVDTSVALMKSILSYAVYIQLGHTTLSFEL